MERGDNPRIARERFGLWNGSVNLTTAGRMTRSRVYWAVLLGATVFASRVSMVSADGIEWNDTMKAAQRAVEESRYADAEQLLRSAVKEAGKFGPVDRRL